MLKPGTENANVPASIPDETDPCTLAKAAAGLGSSCLSMSLPGPWPWLLVLCGVEVAAAVATDWAAAAG